MASVGKNLALWLFLSFLAGLSASGGEAQTLRSWDDVFQLRAERTAAESIAVTLSITPGNYIYRDRLTFRHEGRDLSVEKPAGEEKDDPNFGRVDIYRNSLSLELPDIAAKGSLEVAYQGCSERGICYPPVRQRIDLVSMNISDVPKDVAETPKETQINAEANLFSSTFEPGSGADSQLLSGGAMMTIVSFLGFGLLLAFTPCIFPMIPIVSGMLAGAGSALSARRGFALTLAYVLAMASAYGVAGLIAGWTGYNLQFALQSPLALGAAAVVLVLLALSMFGFYQLSLPVGLSARLAGNLQNAGSIPRAAALGFGSALIVGPCVTPPLAAAMLYALQTGDAIRSSAALFALGCGMGAPLLLVGALGPRILPRSGPWLEAAKQIFGVGFLAIAVILIARLLPDRFVLALWGVFILGAGVFVGAFDKLASASSWEARLSKAAGLIVSLYGAILIVGAAAGSTDPFQPLAALASRPSEIGSPHDNMRVTRAAELDKAVAASVAAGRPVVVHFTADWCTICKANEAAMSDSALQRKLATASLIVADLTNYNADARLLMSRFAIAGPPTLFVVDAKGVEVKGTRLIGAFTAETLADRLSLAGL